MTDVRSVTPTIATARQAVGFGADLGGAGFDCNHGSTNLKECAFDVGSVALDAVTKFGGRYIEEGGKLVYDFGAAVVGLGYSLVADALTRDKNC
jgi:hypothetical protein